MLKKEVQKIIREAVENLQKNKELPEFTIPEILIEQPIVGGIYGDYSTATSLRIAVRTKPSDPMEIAKMSTVLEVKHPTCKNNAES